MQRRKSYNIMGYQLTIISYYYFDTTEIKVSEIQTSYILCPWPGVTNVDVKKGDF